MKKKYNKSLSLFMAFMLFVCFASKAQYNVTVAKDGSGDFTTLQAAIDAAPSGQTTPYKIFIKKGKYREKVTIPSNKPFLYFIGESINETIISWNGVVGQFATMTINAPDCALMNMTLENSYGRQNDGPQALALQANADRLIFKNCRFISGQDTILANGAGNRQYFSNCYLDGNTDFVFGNAIVVFDSCVVFCRDRLDGSTGGYFTAANTPNGQKYGYVFRNCLLPENNGTTAYTLGRPWGNDVQSVPPNPSHTNVVFLNCRMGKNIVPARWSVWSAATDTTVITYAEYNTMYFNGTPVDLSHRLSWTQALTSTQAAPYFVNTNLFGTWDPCTALSSACVPMDARLSLSNVRTNRSTSSSTFRFNLCWPVKGAAIQLLRSTDSLNFSTTATTVASFTTITDTTVSYQFTDSLPAYGTAYFYRVQATKTGLEKALSDTMIKVDISIPINGDYRSAASGGWSNNASAISTLTSGAVSNVTVTSSPTGYTGVPTVTFAAAPAGGITATGTAIVTGGIVTAVTITNAGAGYTTAPSVTFSTTGVGGNSIWEKYTNGIWSAVALGTTANTNVTIKSGHTVTLNGLSSATNVTIEKGATLNSIGLAAGSGVTGVQTFRVGSGVAPVSSVLKNDGVFGSANGTGDGIILEIWTSCSNFTITGSGTTGISRLRPAPNNTNKLNVVVDQDISLGSNNSCFTGYYNTATNNANENTTFTINAGKTVKLTNPLGTIHGNASLNTNPQGNITYNVNGILDLSSQTTVQNFVPTSNAKSTASVTTLNINGKVILGKGGLNTISNITTNTGTAKINVNNGGLLDATLAVNTFKTTTASYGCFITLVGTGAIKRAVAANATLFPIGTSTTSYTPVTLTNSGTADNFTVGIKSTLDNPVADASKIVSKQWSITPDGTGANLLATFGWGTTDQAANFSPTASLFVGRYDGGNWVGTASTTATGTGTLADPYLTSDSNFTSFGNFVVSNAGVLPLKLLAFMAAQKSNLVSLAWATSNEINTHSFVVERSADSKNYTALATIKAKNVAGTNSYGYDDVAPLAGVAYYRLKLIDNDGKYSYSKINLINAKLANVFSIYPNPVVNSITVTRAFSAEKASLKVMSADGKIAAVYTINSNETQSVIDISKLASGHYNMVLYSNNGAVSTLKFVKK
ncbi:pectinesterase family protein [Parasediminibacterium sp. JCM 36343]|uniref:pectinesterase family protein n=1 Tax=Parasediminibacterium sp. JCM 36343 TaxID=3374279 RepID=UPI003979375C